MWHVDVFPFAACATLIVNIFDFTWNVVMELRRMIAQEWSEHSCVVCICCLFPGALSALMRLVPSVHFSDLAFGA